MNKSIIGFCAALALMLSAQAQANLVRVNSEQSYVFGGEDLTGPLAYNVNSASGDYALCYSVELSGFDRVYCRLFNGSDTPLTSILSHDYAAPTQQRVATIDVSVADNGNFYAVVMTQRFGSHSAWLHGWSRTGSALFAPLQIDASRDWLDVAVAATPHGPWVSATVVVPDFPVTNVVVHSFNTAGVSQSSSTLATYSLASFSSFCLEVDRYSDIAANRSGDIAVTWIKPNFSQFCNGTVMTKTMRAGGVSSADRAISAVVRDGAGHDASPNTRPHIAALDNGRFVLSWLDIVAHTSVTATVDPANSIIVPESDMLPTEAFALSEFGANTSNGDFVVAAEQNFASCALQSQLAIEGDLLPLARFSVGGCFNVMHHAVQFLPNGQLSVARSYFDRATLSRVDLPAEIEVNNVTVSEGNPGPGAPPSAAISVTLTKPHPNGEDVHVSYFTRNGTAVAGQDYALTQDTAVFSGATAQTARTLLLPILPDTRYEDDERFTVEFELPVNAVIRHGDERSSVVILDDDRTPLIAPDCDNDDPQICKTRPEPGPGESLEVLVQLDMAQPVGANLQISYATVDGSAHAGSDYIARSGTVQIIAGATSAVIPLTLLGDDVPEDTETFRLRLSAPDAVHLTATDLVIHILDDGICFIEVAPTAIVTESEGSSETLDVTTRAGCNWSVSTPDSWISITSPASNTGSAAITLDVAEFVPPPGVFARSGSVLITLADPLRTLTVPVDQDGDCSFTITPDTEQFAVAGGEGSFAVDASVPECDWTVSSPVPWITILSPLAPVSGDGTVTFQVDDNADEVNVAAETRTVTLSSEEFSYSASQAGCTYALDRSSIAADAAGDVSYSVEMNAPAVCQWTAVSHASWLLIQDGTSGSGEGSIEVFVLDNPTVQPRTGTVSIGNQTLTVTQSGLACDYALTPADIVSCPDGRVFLADVFANDGCAWTVHKNADWVSVLDGISGSGSDQTRGIIDLNLSETPRQSTLQLRAQNIGVGETTLMQEGYLTYETFDAARPADWSYTPDSAWSTSNGNLVGQAVGTGTAMALDPTSSCRECEIGARLALATAASSAGDTLSLLGWYQDADNHVGLAMSEFSNRWTLYQMVQGTRFSTVLNVDKIIPNTFYDVQLTFDGVSFSAKIGSASSLQLPLQGPPPRGSVGLQVNGSNARLAELRVNHIQPSPDRIFSSGFEAAEVTNLSQCQLAD